MPSTRNSKVREAAVRISDNRKSINIDEGDSASSSISIHTRRRSHTSEQFIRFMELTMEGWEDRSNFLWCCTLMGTGNDIFPMMMDCLLTHSGGVFVFLFFMLMLLFGLPMVYMELFLGRYTKLSNCQMYRMAPIFFGFCFMIFILNVFYQPIHVSEETQILVNLLQLLVNPDINKKCLYKDPACYDYKIEGSLGKRKCVPAHLAISCDGEIIRYPMMFQYWAVYKNSTSGLFPYWQLVTGTVISWGIILSIIMRGVKILGRLVKFAFLIHAAVLTVLLFLAIMNGGLIGLSLLFTFNTSKVTYHTITVMIWVSSFRLGLMIPSGYMTYSAYARFESNIVSDSSLIILGSTLLNLYYLLVYCCISGVIAKALEIAPEAVVIIDRGIYLAMVPEMLVYLEASNIFLICYYTSSWLFEIIKIAFYIHMLLLNMYDYFPLTKNFETYIWVISCIFLCFLSILCCHQHVYVYFMPVFWAVYLLFGLGILLATEGIMVFYFYGANRLCDDIYFTMGEPPFIFWKIMWYSIPAIQLVLALLMSCTLLNSKYAVWISYYEITHWLYCAAFYGTLIATLLIATIISIGIKFDAQSLLLYLLKPQFFWGPADKQLRKNRKMFFPESYIRSQPTTKSEEYVIPDEKESSGNDQECKIVNVHNDKIFFNNIGFYTDIFAIKTPAAPTKRY